MEAPHSAALTRASATLSDIHRRLFSPISALLPLARRLASSPLAWSAALQNRLEVSTQQMQVETGEEVTAAREAVADADRRAVAAEGAAAEEREGRVAAEGEVARMQVLLQGAHDTARQAAEECARLHAAVLSVSEVRHALSHRPDVHACPCTPLRVVSRTGSNRSAFWRLALPVLRGHAAVAPADVCCITLRGGDPLPSQCHSA